MTSAPGMNLGAAEHHASPSAPRCTRLIFARSNLRPMAGTASDHTSSGLAMQAWWTAFLRTTFLPRASLPW